MTLDPQELLGAAHAERERLGRTVQYTPPPAWDAESACAGWRNRDVMAHLAAQETAAAQVIAGETAAEFEEFREAQDPPDFWVDGFNEWAVARRSELPYRQVIMEWGRGADRLLVGASKLSDDEWETRRVPWVADEIGVRYLIQSRVVEWWLHGLDIREGAGLDDNRQHWPIFLTNDLAIRMLPYTLGQAGLSYPGRSVRVELEGAGGGVWHYGLAPRETPAGGKRPDAYIDGRALPFALVAGRRAPAASFLDDGNIVVAGDETLALEILDHIQAYA